jgi:hypothetical protein
MSKIAFTTTLTGILVAGGILGKADQAVDSWSVRGLTRPGTWFVKYDTGKTVTVAISKSGEGVGEHK